MENENIAHTANKSTDVDEAPAMATNERSDMSDTTAKRKTHKPRRTAKEIQAEFEEFKALLEEGRPILEIILLMELRKSQADSYLTKISLEKYKQTLSYGVCEGHCLPESIRKMLGGDRKDLYKFEPFEAADGNTVLVKLHKPRR